MVYVRGGTWFGYARTFAEVRRNMQKIYQRLADNDEQRLHPTIIIQTRTGED